MMMWTSIGLGNVLERILKVSTANSYYELEQHKPWFADECSKLLHQNKQAKLQ
jgi:hypothetical protein